MPKHRVRPAMYNSQSEALREYNSIISECQKKGEAFNDSDFPADPRMLFHDPKKPWKGHLDVSSMEWLRPSQMDQCRNPQLFTDGTEAGDVIQGNLGNCWFMGALSVLAADDQLMVSGNTENNLKARIAPRLEEIFALSKPYDKAIACGAWLLKFWKEEEWKYVIIDDQFPCLFAKPIYGRSKDPNELWVMIIEKAYAKVHTCYEGLQSGFVDYGLRDLTGGTPLQLKIERKHHKDETSRNNLWSDLVAYQKEGAIMGCSYSAKGQVETEFQLGIVRGHAYGVLRLEDGPEFKSKGKDYHLIRIRNPWGKREWSGAWSDNSKEWSEHPNITQFMESINYKREEDGTFYMDFKDFIEYFNTIFIVRFFNRDTYNEYKIEGEWKGNCMGGCPRVDTWWKNPQYPLSVNEKRPTEVTIVITQPDMRTSEKNFNDYGDRAIGFIILKSPPGRKNEPIVKMRKEDLVGTSAFKPQREVSLCLTLESGNFMLIPQIFDPGVAGEFKIQVISSGKITVATESHNADSDADTSSDEEWDIDTDMGVRSAASAANWDRQHENEPSYDQEKLKEAEENPGIHYMKLFEQMDSTIKELRGMVYNLSDRVNALDGLGPVDEKAAKQRMTQKMTILGEVGSPGRYSQLNPQDVYDLKCREYKIKPNSKIRIDPNAEAYDFSANYFGAKGWLPVIEALKCNQKFTALNVSSVGLEDAGCQALVAMLKNHPRLTRLNVSGNYIEEPGGQALLDLVRTNPNITELDYSNNDIERDLAHELSRALERNASHVRALKEAANIFLTTNDPSVLINMADAYKMQQF